MEPHDSLGVVCETQGSASFPFFGCAPVILDNDSNELDGEAEGFLAIKAPWPSILRTVYGDHARMESVYFERFKGYVTSPGALASQQLRSSGQTPAHAQNFTVPKTPSAATTATT